jgi:hypothetical protein
MRFVLLVSLIFATAVYGHPYLLLSDDAVLLEQDSIAYPFSTGDTLSGGIRVNGPIAMSGSPQFYDSVITSAAAFIEGPGYAPNFHGAQPVFNAPPIVIPTQFTDLRQIAWDSGRFYPNDEQSSYRVSIRGGSLRIYRWLTGTSFDSMTAVSYNGPLFGHVCIFFERPLEILGHLHGQLTIGSSEDILLVDNLWYDCTALAPHGYALPPNFENTCGDILGIVSEKDIKIANTYANGRNNSNGRGFQQNNHDSTDIVIMGTLWAAGKITFEQQNDPDSGYVCDSVPDLRGRIYLLGSMVQPHYTTFLRSNNDSTGYLLKANLDPRYRWMQPTCLPAFPDELPVSPESSDFGDVPSDLQMDVYPNPFNATTTIHYTLPHNGAVALSVLDLLGRTAMSVDAGERMAGEHSLQVNGTRLASGVYFVRLQSAHQTVTQKILLLK